MNIIKKSPEPFIYLGNKSTGILLIHGFTGSPAEMALLGEYLNNEGYTVYAPLLAGHGRTPEEMAETGEDDWWKSVLEAYYFLQNKGYKDVYAIGLSMGGILSLKLAVEKELAGVIPMAAPIYVQSKFIGLSRWIKYVKGYQGKKKKEQHIEQYLASYDKTPIVCVESLNRLIKEVKADLNKVKAPIQVMQGKRDETVKYQSAEYIYNHVASENKRLIWYEKSSHIMTLDRERDNIFKDILIFIQKL